MTPDDGERLARALKRAVFTYHMMTLDQARTYAQLVGLPPAILDDNAS